MNNRLYIHYMSCCKILMQFSNQPRDKKRVSDFSATKTEDWGNLQKMKINLWNCCFPRILHSLQRNNVPWLQIINDVCLVNISICVHSNFIFMTPKMTIDMLLTHSRIYSILTFLFSNTRCIFEGSDILACHCHHTCHNAFYACISLVKWAWCIKRNK